MPDTPLQSRPNQRPRRPAGRGFMPLALGALLAPSVATAASPPALEGLDAVYPSLEALYTDIHQHPELSLHEEQTAGKLAARLRALGYEVTERVGGFGIVGVLRNGDGPAVLLRTDMDALPVHEQTGLPYASAVTTKNAAGETVPVMHACGHDVHMAAWVGAAALLAQSKDQWRGTLVLVGQPAEEVVKGAEAMVKDGLFTRFPKPDYILGIHVTNQLPAGQIGVIPGPASAASNAVDITFYGKGGHGAAPQLTIDPIVMAARAVVTLQTIVAREIDPLDPAVVTVGSFHAGAKRNIIPDEATILLTVRSYKPEVQKHLLEAITRIAKAEAAAAGATREPQVVIDPAESSQVCVNDPALASRLTMALGHALGRGNVVPLPPATTSEDIGVYGRASGAPGIQLRVGAINPAEFAAAEKAGRVLMIPGPHNAMFAPDREPTIKAAVEAYTVSAMELLDHPAPHP